MAEHTSTSTETEESTDPTVSEEAQNFIDYQTIPSYESQCVPDEPGPPVLPVVECPTCEPNPAAPNIDWTKTTENEPFLNKRKCTYSINLRTKYEGTGGDSTLQARLDEYTKAGAIRLLAHFNKALDENTVAVATALAGATDHFIPPRVKLKMRVLIEIPANEFDLLPNAQDVPDVSPEILEAIPPKEIVTTNTLNMQDFDQQIDKLIEGLKVYAKYQAIYYQTQRGAIRFPGGAPVNLNTEAEYLRKVKPALYDFLRTKGWVPRNPRGLSDIFKTGDIREANKVELGLAEDGTLERIVVTSHGSCEETPTEYKGIQIASLRGQEPFNRPTSLNWLMRIDESVQALIQREGMMKWTEFAETFVYPTPTINQGADMTSAISAMASAAVGQASDADLDAIQDAVVKMTETERIESKTPGSWEDIADHLTSPASRERSMTQGAFAESEQRADEWPYKSHDPNSPTYRGQQKIWDPTLNNGEGGYRLETEQEAHNRSNANLAAENSHLVTSGELIEGLCEPGAVSKFFNDLGDDFMNEVFSIWDSIMYQFHNFICMTPEERQEMLDKIANANDEMMSAAIREAMKILIGFFEMLNTLQYNLQEIRNIEGLYKKGLDEITFCGLFDLMLAFLDCLMQGFDLGEVLEVLIAATLASLPPLELEKVFVGLPPEDQAAILAKVEAHIGAHTLPWQSKAGEPDPAADAPFSNRPMSGNQGSNIAWGGPGSPVAKEKAESRQSQTAVTPALQALARGFEDTMRGARRLAQEFEDKVRLARLDRPDDSYELILYDVRTEFYSGEDFFTLGYFIDDSTRIDNSDQSAMTYVLSKGQHANALANYFTEYEIEGYKDAGITGDQITTAPGDYISALQDLLTRVNSASTITNSTDGSVDTPVGTWTGSETDDPFPDKSARWKNEYYTAYSKNYAQLQAEYETLDEPTRSEMLARIETEAHELAAMTATMIEEADKGEIGDPGPFGTRGSLGAAVGSTVSMVLSEYIKAILEYYSEKGYDALMEALNKLPGAAIIAKIIALLDCAIPPLWDPPLLDFLNTLEIDFCNMVIRLTAPGPPNLQMPNWKDFFRFLLELAKQIAIYIIFRLLLWLLTKIVFILFDSLCSMLEKLGEAALNAINDQICASLGEGGEFAQNVSVAMEAAGHCESPPRGFLNMVKGAFCGPNATDEQAQEVANAAMKHLGSVTEADAAKMANEGAVNQLVADISTVLTGGELTNLLLGNVDPVATSLVQEIVESENPAFSSILGSGTQIADLFKNIGNLLPNDFKRQLKAQQDVLPAVRPANPMLCKTKEELDEFRTLREQILTTKDGTTPRQAQQQFDALRGRALNDISQIADLMNGGVENFIENNMPPFVGEPDENGCLPPDALIPRDPPLMMDLIGETNESLYDIVGRAYARDINGRGGFMNMILSDTYGHTWRRHQFESVFNDSVVDYKAESLKRFGIDVGELSELDPLTPEGLFLNALYKRERGHYPKYVGQYFKEYLRDNKHNPDGYKSTSKFTPTEYTYFPEDEIPLGSLIPQGLFPTDDRGVFLGTAENPFVTPGQKNADVVLKFRDNARGINQDSLPDNMQFSDGFNIEYGSYVIDDTSGTEVTNTDNVYRLKVVEVTNPFAIFPGDPVSIAALAEGMEDFDKSVGGVEDVRFDIVITGSLTEQAESLRTQYVLDKLPASPQVNCWNGILHDRYTSLGLDMDQIMTLEDTLPFAGPDLEQGNITHDNIMNTLLNYFGKMISRNDASYNFGYTPGEDDDLTPEDKLYMSPDGEKTFNEYIMEDLVPELGDSYMIFGTLPNFPKIAKYIKDNEIMGQSNHPRMHFLSPSEHGGSWMAPPYYIEPPKYEGWLGIRDVLLPEVDGKDPKRYPVCNFEDIKERVDELTKKMPDDPRLSECPDCVIELPYSRILDRASASGMEGPIISMIRVYCVEEMVKAMPIFSKFKAAIPEVMDYTYVEYILATMKEDFIENLSRKAGFLRGEALWYTFLEQCVQSFARQMQLDGREVGPEVQAAIDALNEMQEDFKYPSEKDHKQALMKAGLNPWAAFANMTLPVAPDPKDFQPEKIFGRKVGITTKLQTYRRWHLLQAVKDTEHHANVIVRLMIEEQLEYIAGRFAEMLEQGDPGLVPDIDNIYEYFIGESGFVAGHSEFSLKKSAQPMESPKIFDVGSRVSYREMTGETNWAVSNPLEQYETSLDANKLNVKVTVNDDGYYSVNSYTSRFTNGEFFLEKYVRVTDKNGMGVDVPLPEEIANRPSHIDGVVSIKDWKAWLESISEEYGESRLSDFFGDLEFTYATDSNGNPTGEVTGIEGQMGVRYGLRLCYIPPVACVEQLDEIFDNFKTSENWSLINENVKKEKAYYVQPARLSQDGLNVTSVTLVDPDGNSIESGDSVQALNDIWSGDRGTSIRETEASYVVSNSRYVIPLVSAEYDALDHTIAQHITNIDFDMDLYCLGQELVKQPEFELLFQYVFPLNRLVSLMGVYTGMGFVMSIGEKTNQPDFSNPFALFRNGLPVANAEQGEWAHYILRSIYDSRFSFADSFDDWDMEFFKRTKRRLVKMFRSYYKSREWLDKEDDDKTKSEKDRKKNRDNANRKKGRGSRKFKRRRRDRPYDKNGN